MLEVGAGLGVAIGGLDISSAVFEAGVSKGAELGLGLFNSFFLDGLLNGQNPSMFVEKIEQLIKKNET